MKTGNAANDNYPLNFLPLQQTYVYSERINGYFYDFPFF